MVMNTRIIRLWNSKYISSSCFLWVSINKPLDIEFWQNQIEYLEDNYQRIIILIADKIDIINQVNIENKSYEEALINTWNKFILWEKFLKKRIKDIAKRKKISQLKYVWIKNKFTFVSWNDISNTVRFKMIYSILKENHLKDKKFRDDIWAILINYLKARWKIDIIKQDLLDHLSDYIINELVTLIDGIDYKNKHYSNIVYPTFKETVGGMNKLAANLHSSFNTEVKLRWDILIESCL